MRADQTPRAVVLLLEFIPDPFAGRMSYKTTKPWLVWFCYVYYFRGILCLS